MILGGLPLAAGGVALGGVWWAVRQAEAMDRDVAAYLAGEGSKREVRVWEYSDGTRWVAGSLGWDDTDKGLDRLGGEPASVDKTVVFLGRWLLSPMRHYESYTVIFSSTGYSGRKQGPRVSTAQSAALLKRLTDHPYLEMLLLSDLFEVDDAGMAEIGRLSKLEYLRLVGIDVSEAAVAQAVANKRLKLVDIEFKGPVTDGHVDPLCRAVDSRLWVSAESGRVTAKACAGLSGRKLKAVLLVLPLHCRGDSAALGCFDDVLYELELVLPDAEGAELARLGTSAVEDTLHLDFSGNAELRDDGLDALVQAMATRPWHAAFKGNGYLTGKPITRLLVKGLGSQMPGGKWRRVGSGIELSQFNLEESFFALPPGVNYLILSECRMTGACFKMLSGYAGLNLLKVNKMTLGREDVEAISRIPNLYKLAISNVHLTREQVEAIGTMKKLEILEVDVADDVLLKALPKDSMLRVIAQKDLTTGDARKEVPGVVVEVSTWPEGRWVGY